MSVYPTWDTGDQDAAAPFLDQWASVYGLPRNVVYGQCSLESGFNADATGAAGEIGLMQIKLTTAQAMGYTGSASDLYDPDSNVHWGLAYLRSKLDQYGDISLALSAYNAGRPIQSNVGTYVASVLDRAAYFSTVLGGGLSLWAAAGLLGAGLVLWRHFIGALEL